MWITSLDARLHEINKLLAMSMSLIRKTEQNLKLIMSVVQLLGAQIHLFGAYRSNDITQLESKQIK